MLKILRCSCLDLLNSSVILVAIIGSYVHMPRVTVECKIGKTGNVINSFYGSISKCVCARAREIEMFNERNIISCREKGQALASRLGVNSEFVEVNIDNVNTLEAALNGA